MNVSRPPPHETGPFCALIRARAARAAFFRRTPSDFVETVIAGLNARTAMQFAPDGRLFILRRAAGYRVGKDGSLVATPFLTIQKRPSTHRAGAGLADGDSVQGAGGREARAACRRTGRTCIVLVLRRWCVPGSRGFEPGLQFRDELLVSGIAVDRLEQRVRRKPGIGGEAAVGGGPQPRHRFARTAKLGMRGAEAVRDMVIERGAALDLGDESLRRVGLAGGGEHGPLPSAGCAACGRSRAA